MKNNIADAMVDIWPVLKKMGVHEVQCRYSGSGDSGSFELARYINESGESVEIDKDVKVPWVVNSSAWSPSQGWIHESKLEEGPLDEVISDVAHDVLHKRHAGWENNEGGEGCVVFYVNTYQVKLEHREFIQTHQDYEYEEDATPPALRLLAAEMVEK